MVKVVSEGNIQVDINFKGKVRRIQLTQVLHIPGVDGKILSLKILDQKGFKTRISRGYVHIMKVDESTPKDH